MQRHIGRRMLVSMLIAPMVASGTPGCAEKPFDEECTPQEWHEEAEEHPDSGISAAISLEGSQVRVEGDEPTVEQVSAPLTIVPGGSSSPFVAFAGPVVDGDEVRTLVLFGAEIAATNGRFVLDDVAATEIDEQAAWVTPSASSDDGTRPSLGTIPTLDQATLNHAIPVNLGAQELRITAYETGYIVSDTGTRPVTGPITVSATRAYWDRQTSIGADSIVARWDGDVAIGLSPRSGSLRTADGPTEALPQVILGRDAHLEVGPGHVRTIEDMFVRQALDQDGPLLASTLELRLCAASKLVMHEGEPRTLRLAFRQPGNLTDATFSEAWFHDGSGIRQEVQLNIDDAIPVALTSFANANSDASWGSAVGEFFAGLVEAFAEIFVAIIGCIITFGLACGDDSEDHISSLDAYPGWIEPNQIGEFEVTVTPSSRGRHDARLEIIGHNYVASVPMKIVVRR